MILIDTFAVSSDFKTLDLAIRTDGTFTLLEIFVGSDYLIPYPIDLTASVITKNSAVLSITMEDLGLNTINQLDPNPIQYLEGIFTVHITDSTTYEITQAISNMYFINLTLANMILTRSVSNGWEDINTIYLLVKAINTFIPANKIEQALNAYERVLAMVENDPSYLVLVDTDVSSGSGQWIINGTYIIK